MEAALRDITLIGGEGASMVTQHMLQKGHSGVVGIITSGGELPSVAK